MELIETLSERFFELQKNLERPLVFFDTETTGVNPKEDRIVEISLVKITKRKIHEPVIFRMNPGIPIPNGASKVHGIYDDDVADLPGFDQFAKKIWKELEGADYAGYNLGRFDIPILQAEFERHGFKFDLSEGRVVDPLVIFKTKMRFDLTSAVQHYAGKELDNAHNSLVDTLASLEVLSAQLERHEDLPTTINELCVDQMNQAKQRRRSGGKPKERIVLQEGAHVMNFGRHKGKKLGDVPKDYLQWMLKSKDEFPEGIQKIVKKHLKGRKTA